MAKSIKPGGKVFRDPVHSLIRIDPDDLFILQLIDTPEFQRLRRIRQLGVSSLTFHGAEHSRFAHSLGVFNFCQRIIEALTRRYSKNSDVVRYLDEHKQVAKAAALLHDVGHGAFSHLLEHAVAGFQHEEKTQSLIKDRQGEIFAVLGEERAGRVADIINKTSPERLIVDLVSSQLDADRMDYLLRDCHMTGVEYGRFDAEWLLNAMCIGTDPSRGSDPSPQAWRLCLDEARGQDAAEQFILARSHMTTQVYMHRVTRGYEMLLGMLLRAVQEALRSGDESLTTAAAAAVCEFFRSPTSIDRRRWLDFDDGAMIGAMQAWASSPKVPHHIRELSGAFLRRERLLACRHLRSSSANTMTELSERLAEIGLTKHKDWVFDDGLTAVYKGVLTPRGGDEQEALAHSILLSEGKPGSRASPIENRSDIFRSVDGRRHVFQPLYSRRSKQQEVDRILESLSLIPRPQE